MQQYNIISLSVRISLHQTVWLTVWLVKWHWFLNVCESIKCVSVSTYLYTWIYSFEVINIKTLEINVEWNLLEFFKLRPSETTKRKIINKTYTIRNYCCSCTDLLQYFQNNTSTPIYFNANSQNHKKFRNSVSKKFKNVKRANLSVSREQEQHSIRRQPLDARILTMRTMPHAL